MTIPSTTGDLIAEIELDFQSARKLGREAYIDMQDGEALIARIRELEQYKSEAIEVMGPVLDYARPLNLAKLGESITQALISDHQRLVELEQAQRWIPCSERLPEIAQRLDSPLTSSGGHVVLPLNISVPVIYYDGNSAKSGPVNWFDGGAPLSGVTHWMPLPGRPQ
jgi:hypothetical protein